MKKEKNFPDEVIKKVFLQKLKKYYEICEKYRKWRENNG